MLDGIPPLLTALASGADASVPDLAREVPEEEWPRLLEIVRRHGLTPLLSEAVLPHGDTCPPTVQDALRTHRDYAMLWHRIQMNDLALILEALGGASIPHLLMKGTALGFMVYRHPWLRLVGDTDLLVPTDRVEEAHELALGLGFKVTEEWADAHHLPALQRGSNPPIERQHHSLYVPTPEPGYTLVPVDFSLLDVEAGTVDAGGFEARVPSARDALLQLSCNFGSHMEESIARPLRWVRDYAELLGRGRVRWSEVEERVDFIAPDLRTTVLMSLALARPFIGDSYEPALLEAIDGLPNPHARLTRVVSPRDMVHEWTTSPRRAWHVLSCLMGPWRATKWSLNKLLVSREHIALQTGLSGDALCMRVYPIAFALHAIYHLRRADRSRGE